jgi:hypothetical protein
MRIKVMKVFVNDEKLLNQRLVQSIKRETDTALGVEIPPKSLSTLSEKHSITLDSD